MSPNFSSKSFNRFLQDVFPALPVIAIIFALEAPLLSKANLLRKVITLLTCNIFFLYFLFTLEETIRLTPFFMVSGMNLFPSFFIPFIAKNKLFFFTSLESRIILSNS